MILEVNQMGHVFYIGILITTIPLLAGNDVIQPKSYNLEQFLNASERELRAHKKQLDTLEKQGTLQITPSQAQLFYPDPIENREQFEKGAYDYAGGKKPWINPRWYGGNAAHTVFTPKELSELNRVMTEDEKIHAKGGATVYHSTVPFAYGQSYIRTKAEDMVRELQGQPVAPSKWLMLRNWRDNFSTEKGKRQQYLATGLMGIDTGNAYDEAPHIAADMISCSTGLPYIGRMESALYFWKQKGSSKKHVLPPLHISGQYGPELENISYELYDEIEKLDNAINTGILLQAAVKDKRLLDKLMYPSRGYGYKWKPEIGAGESKRTLETSQEVFETMMHKPSALETDTWHSPQLGGPQTRTVLTGDFMLDPTNPKVRANVAFNAYADNQEALDKFHTKIDAYFAQQKNRIKTDYQIRYNKMNLPQKFWHNLQSKLCMPSSYTERKLLNKEGGNLFIRGNTFSGE